MINKILDYQKLDMEITKAEKDLNFNEHRKTANNMRSYVKDAQDRIINLDKQCENIINEYNNILANYEKADKQLNFIESNKSKFSKEEKEKYVTQLDNIVKVLDGYERKLNEYQDKVNDILKIFDETKKKVYVAKIKYKEANEKFLEVQKESLPEINSKKAKLKELEKVIKPQIISKYKSIKAEKKTPVFVPETNNCCSGCKCKIPTSKLEILKNNQILECESCHRIIYIK